jgi:murein DD-endopeptidase MepM/ murein hydrolase activator NlpD
VGQGYFGSATHQGIQALDFEMPEGTTICASRDGVVAGLKEDSSMGGQSPAYARLGNYVEILHDDGTWSTYAHLKLDGALVREGDRVRAGDPIALSGQTGQASGPHLHFSAQKARWNGPPETIPTCFALDLNKNGFLQEGEYYYAWHPGKPAFERKDASSVDEAALERKLKPALGGKISFREERVDNKVLLYCFNPSPKKLEVTVSFASSRNVVPSKPLPFSTIVPAKSEAFLLSILMKGGSSYETRFNYRPLP